MHRGYVKDWRRILEWEWYTDYKTCHLFRHCILRANVEDKQWKGQLIKKGSFVTSLENLSRETGLSVQNIRTSFKKLTSELTIKTTNRNTIISIKNYENYQGLTSNLTNNQQTTNKLLTTTKEYKNEKNEKKFIVPTVQQVEEYCKERNNNIDAEYFINYYDAKGWMIGKNKVKDWKACIRTWEQRNKKDIDKNKYDAETERQIAKVKQIEEERRKRYGW